MKHLKSMQKRRDALACFLHTTPDKIVFEGDLTHLHDVGYQYGRLVFYVLDEDDLDFFFEQYYNEEEFEDALEKGTAQITGSVSKETAFFDWLNLKAKNKIASLEPFLGGSEYAEPFYIFLKHAID